MSFNLLKFSNKNSIMAQSQNHTAAKHQIIHHIIRASINTQKLNF